MVLTYIKGLSKEDGFWIRFNYKDKRSNYTAIQQEKEEVQNTKEKIWILYWRRIDLSGNLKETGDD